MEIKIEHDFFAHEAQLAAQNQALFQEMGLMAINLLAGPGAGKTSLIKQTHQMLSIPFAVIEGDPASSLDTEHLMTLGIPAVQINTEGGCHLEAAMIFKALESFKPAPRTLLWIENIGNLICTAGYPLGEALRIAMVGASEGDDKPFKYPYVFQDAACVIVNKIDLKPYVEFDSRRFAKGVQSVNRKAPIFEVSCKTGAGMEPLIHWLKLKAREFWGAS
jgi:hydrogenase nickel incorporation protein HypB